MRNMLKCALSLLAGLCVLAGNAGAQFKNGSQATELNIPRVSQRGTVSQRIGLTDITITYHRPEVGGREIWGKTVPFGKVWRAGANENTAITFSDDISVEGKPLAAGTYGLHTIPDKEQWTIIFSKNSTSWARGADVHVRGGQTGFGGCHSALGETGGSLPRLGGRESGGAEEHQERAAKRGRIHLGRIRRGGPVVPGQQLQPGRSAEVGRHLDPE